MLLSNSIIAASPILFILMMMIFRFKKVTLNLPNYLVVFLFFIYITGVISLTLFPIPIDERLISDRLATGDELRNNLIPFATIREMYNTMIHVGFSVFLLQIGGNILLLFPLGFFIPLLFKKINSYKKIILFGFSFSLLIELTQLTISFLINYTYKSFDIDDLILNTIGSILGFIVLKLTLPVLKYLINIDHLRNRLLER